MRCKHCGWNIPDKNGKCEKCGGEMLNDDSGAAKSSRNVVEEKPTTRRERKAIDDSLRKTINENDFKRLNEHLNETVLEEKDLCPECHLELEDGVCPSCGYHNNLKYNEQITEENMKEVKDVKKVGGKTTRWDPKADVAKGRFVLTPLSGKTRMPEGDPILFPASIETELNRDNTDPENSTITSKTQAVVSFEDGKWGITDGSELKSTFVQATRKVELQNGDLILLGNQLYRFDSITE